jgi:hypothetical protein
MLQQLYPNQSMKDIMQHLDDNIKQKRATVNPILSHRSDMEEHSSNDHPVVVLNELCQHLDYPTPITTSKRECAWSSIVTMNIELSDGTKYCANARACDVKLGKIFILPFLVLIHSPTAKQEAARQLLFALVPTAERMRMNCRKY